VRQRSFLAPILDKAFPCSGVTIIHQHRWLAYWMLASAIALAIRLRRFRNAQLAAKEQAISAGFRSAKPELCHALGDDWRNIASLKIPLTWF